MLESEVVPQSNVNHFDSHSDKLPTFVADISLVTTGTDIIVIGQINIKTQLLGYRFEGRGFTESLSIARVSAVYWANFESGRHEA